MPGEKPAAEDDSPLIDSFALAIDYQFAVATMREVDGGGGGGHGGMDNGRDAGTQGRRDTETQGRRLFAVAVYAAVVREVGGGSVQSLSCSPDDAETVEAVEINCAGNTP